MSRARTAALVLIVMAIASVHPARAGVSELVERQEWVDAVGSFTTIDFIGFLRPTLLRNQYIDRGIRFSDTDDYTCFDYRPFPIDGSGVISEFRNNQIRVAFFVPQSWVAVDMPQFVHIELYRQGRFIYRSSSLSIAGRVGNFGGVISDEPFDAVMIEGGGQQVGVDDLHFGRGAGAARGLLRNTGFERAGASGSSVEFTGIGEGGESAAADWIIVNGTDSTTKTELIPSTLTGGETMMLHVVTNGGENGVVQDAFGPGLGLDCGLAAVWVRVVRGEAFLAVGNREAATARRFPRWNFVWERVDLLNVECPANRISIMSGPGAGGEAGAEFFVDQAAFAKLCPCGQDLDNDYQVGLSDLMVVLERWGTDPPCRPDFDADGEVGASDLLAVLGAWGRCEGR